MDATKEIPRPKPSILPIVAALIVGGVIGYWFGRKAGLELANRYSTNPCIGGGVKNLSVSADGTPSCPEVEDFPAAGGRVNWTGPAGSTLKIILKDPNAFPNLECHYNLCDSGLPATSAYSTTQEYAAFVYLKGTTTPPPPTPTPTPRSTQLGRIIIKP